MHSWAGLHSSFFAGEHGEASLAGAERKTRKLLSKAPTKVTEKAAKYARKILSGSPAKRIAAGKGKYALLKTSCGFPVSSSTERPLAR